MKCAERLPLKLVPMPIAVPPMVEMLQWHKVHDCDPANQWLRRLLKETVSNMPHEPPLIRENGHTPQALSATSGRARGRRTAASLTR